jgi:ABC-type transport system involved in multi-copper enzyme maturation permease subunit
MSAAVGRLNTARGIAGGITAVSIKELRGRMRGRRAFVLLTIHLLAVAGFAFFVQYVVVGSTSSFGSGPQAADIGRGLFDALLFFLTIVVLILAPASTSGAVSLEREKQTLDLLVTTPVSSLAIVLGKLIAALGWMAMLLFASIPVMALVFMYGGVGPEDLLRAYVVLGTTAIFYGTMGLFISALFKRTQAATVLNLVLAVVLTLGTGIVYGGMFALKLSDAQQQANEANKEVDWSTYSAPPQFLLWLDPAAADLDVACHADQSLNGTCSLVLMMTDRFDLARGAGNGGQAFEMPQDSYWPKAVVFMLAMSALLVLGATQLISPTRRFRRPGRNGAKGATPVAAAVGAVEAPSAGASEPDAAPPEPEASS